MKSKNFNKTYIFFIAAAFCLLGVKLSSGDSKDAGIKKVSYVDALIEFLKETGADSYEWNINEENSWEDLHTFLPKAKLAGVAVSVNLLPPTMSPPLCDTCSYSEPYKLDYKKWAEEIAKLSLRYSNLKDYSIKDLTGNIAEEYLTKDYIDSMTALSSSINPKLKFIIKEEESDEIPSPPPYDVTAVLENININPNLPYELAPKLYNKWQNWEIHSIPNKQRASIVENPSYDEVNSSPSVGRVRIFYNDDYSDIANSHPRSELTLYPKFNLNYGHTYKISWDDYLPTDFVVDNSIPGGNYNYVMQLKSTYQDSPPFVLYQDGDNYAFRHAIYLPEGSYYEKTTFGSITEDRGKWQHWELNVYLDSTNKGWVTLYQNGIKVDSNSHRTYPRIPFNSAFYFKIGSYKYDWLDYPKVQDSIVRYIDNIIFKNLTTGEEFITTFGIENEIVGDSIVHIINLNWKNSHEQELDSTFIYSSLKNDTTTAIKIAALDRNQTSYRHTLKSETIRYYWLKNKGKNGKLSSFSEVAVDTKTIYIPNN